MILLATILKDWRLLVRDRVGLMLLFGMPILLVLLVTGIQNNAFPSGAPGGMLILVRNADTGRYSREVIKVLGKGGRFHTVEVGATAPAGGKVEVGGEAEVPGQRDVAGLLAMVKKRSAVVAVDIPADFSGRMTRVVNKATHTALRSFGLDADSGRVDTSMAGGNGSPRLLFHPGIDASAKAGVEGAVEGALQAVQSREVLKALYLSINEKPLPDSLEARLLGERMSIEEVGGGTNGVAVPLNATQHNVPAWTIFAMFFVVMSLGGSVIRERTGGSAIRLQTLPTHYMMALVSKQVVYLGVTLLQAVVIFSLGVWLFPVIGLPALVLPHDLFGLMVVTLLCGWCAVSYALLIGVIAKTQEQSNGFGAISVVILSLAGGLMVPPFVMPASFQPVMRLSPLHWALECYYGLFLEGGSVANVVANIVPLAVITVLLQAVVLAAVKQKRLI